MRDHLGIPLLRGLPLSGDRLRSNPPPPGPSTPAPLSSLQHWRGCLFLSAGLVAAILLANAAVHSVIGLSSAERPAVAKTTLAIPSFDQLLECNAHFSHEILRIKNKMPAQNAATDLPLLHRNYRRLHRIMRQVGRRDGIASHLQTDRLRQRVNQLKVDRNSARSASRDQRCKEMAEMPIANKRNSQRIVGR